MATANQEIAYKISIDKRQAGEALVSLNQGFDGVNVSTKELQERIAYLNAEMRKMETQYGKSGMASSRYAMLQRESKFAVDQLLRSETALEGQTVKSARGLGSLGSASIAALGSVSGLGTGISVLTNSLMSGAGLSAGLAAITIGFSLLMEVVRGANEETEKFNKSVSSLIDVQLPGGGFKIKPENLPSVIDKLKSDIEYYTTKTSQGTTKGEFFDPNIIPTWKETLKILEDVNEKYQEQKGIIEALQKQGLIYTEDDKKKRKEKKKDLGDINKLLKEMYDIVSYNEFGAGRFKQSDKMKPFREFWVGGQKEGTKPPLKLSDAEKEFLKENKLLLDTITTSADVLRSEFSSAWRDIFGEANSLFEKLLMNITEQLASQAISNLAGGLLNWLVPNLGTVAGLVTGSQKNPSIINLQVDNRTLASFYVGGKNEASRLRMN